jgi:hypothetical protein
MITGIETDFDGTKWHWKNNLLHREDGPAAEFASGSRSWYINGKRHRLDGPAQMYSTGTNTWYYHGKFINASSQKEFEQYLRLLAFI